MGVIHCDIKEGNILVTFDKENQLDPLCANLPLAYKIADFGIARDLTKEDLSKIVLNSGTPRYMAPEQYTSKRGEM